LHTYTHTHHPLAVVAVVAVVAVLVTHSLTNPNIVYGYKLLAGTVLLSTVPCALQ
jgi:hypothetical protein